MDVIPADTLPAGWCADRAFDRMQTHFFPASARGTKDIGWLKSNFYFSFSNFADPTRSAFGTLLAFNDDFVAPGGGFGTHPHMNMEIISVMLAGSMNHKDSLGYSNVVHTDWVQIMSAGSGLRHEEYSVGEEEVSFLQIWIQPKLQNIQPRYQFRHFPKVNRRNRVQTIVSGEEGATHCWINQNTRISLAYFDQAQTISYRFDPTNKCLFVFVIAGALQIDGQQMQKRDALGIWETGELDIHISEPSEFLIVETPINQK